MTRLVLAALALACATPAHAEWQGIEWGMTSEEIEAEVLTTLVLHFPSSDEWTCKTTIRAPFGR